MKRYILTSKEIDKVITLGGKAGNLARLTKFKISVPSWIVVTPDAFNDSLSPKQRKTLQKINNFEEINPIIINFVIDENIKNAIEKVVEKYFSEGTLFAVRSSASYEDSSSYSFAGQLESYLCIPHSQVVAKVIEVWKSGFSSRVFDYISSQKIGIKLKAPTVIIQKIVPASVSGVSFSIDPVSKDSNKIVISSTFGFGTALVSGETNADTYCINKSSNEIVSNITQKNTIHTFDIKKSIGIKTSPLSKQQSNKSSLNDTQIEQISSVTKQIEKAFQCPQDIEWAIDQNNNLYILQSRPITTIKTKSVINPLETFLWDNSNITESYSGISSPLTFSFARKAYEEVYKQFCKTLSVPQKRIDENQTLFRCMLGYIHGRIYYNLLNWYRLLMLLPGFQSNRAFMEQMMGVKEELASHFLSSSKPISFWKKLFDQFQLLISILSLVKNFILLDSKIKLFYAHLNQILGEDIPDLSKMNEYELWRYYENLERNILAKWDIPIINDFLTMIWFGLLKKCCISWLQDDHIHNDLVLNEGGMISTAPAEFLQKMAKTAKKNPELIDYLCHQSAANILPFIKNYPEFNQEFTEYLKKYEDRCSNELKLESLTLKENPLILFRTIGQLGNKKGKVNIRENFRQKAENIVKSKLNNKPIKKLVFFQALKMARKHIKNRENLRYERTRVFARARHIFREFGEKFYHQNIIKDKKDIFYMQIQEIYELLYGINATDIKQLVEIRKQSEKDIYCNENIPDRFQVQGITETHLFPKQDNINPEKQSQHSLVGLGCCPGKVKGQVQVVLNPQTTEIKENRIIVARSTDPGWVMIFPLAKGLLVEKGSLLSHSAIVARELGIPAVVSINGLLDWLKTDDWVEFDGQTGVITKIHEK